MVVILSSACLPLPANTPPLPPSTVGFVSVFVVVVAGVLACLVVVVVVIEWCCLVLPVLVVSASVIVLSDADTKLYRKAFPLIELRGNLDPSQDISPDVSCCVGLDCLLLGLFAIIRRSESMRD